VLDVNVPGCRALTKLPLQSCRYMKNMTCQAATLRSDWPNSGATLSVRLSMLSMSADNSQDNMLLL